MEIEGVCCGIDIEIPFSNLFIKEHYYTRLFAIYNLKLIKYIRLLKKRIPSYSIFELLIVILLCYSSVNYHNSSGKFNSKLRLTGSSRKSSKE